MSNPLINLTMKSSLPSVGMSEAELLSVLENSIYPGAKPESIKLAIGYCRASGLDPMQKPVHIVPMLVSTGKKDGKGYDIKEWRDVIMPGIGLYRTQAARSGQYAGVSEPEFGQDVTEEFDGVSLTYPAWCRVTVKKSLPNGIVAEFSVKEFWKENYATRGKSAEPNSMWRKRPYAQIAKCAEAQALRKAFPEIGAQPTADEMEGKNPDDDETIIDSDTGEILKPEAPEETKALLPYPEDRLEDSLQKWKSLDITVGQVLAKINSSYAVSPEQEARIRAALDAQENERKAA